MLALPTIQLRRPLARAGIIAARPGPGTQEGPAAGSGGRAWPQSAPAPDPRAEDLRRALQQEKDELAQLVQILNELARSLHTLHEQTLAQHHAEIAQLAVEIARKILRYKVGAGDYEIQAIVEEALQQAPTRQNLIVRLNPDDLLRCQQVQQENPDSPLAEVELAADGSVGRGECLVESPKGLVRSFIEEHLERIGEALQRVE